MSVKFFGQFLALEGVVDDEQLRNAVELTKSRNMLLGELAVEDELITTEQTLQINREQLNRDLPFGQIAVDLGLLTQEQVESLLVKQNEIRLRLGEACVQLGYFDDVTARKLLEKFHEEQALYNFQNATLPENIAKNRTANFVLNFLPRIAMRVSRIHVKIVPTPVEENIEPNIASIALEGPEGLRIGLGSSGEYAGQLLKGMHLIMAGEEASEEETQEDVQNVLGSFLDIIAGNCLVCMASMGLNLKINPPVLGGRIKEGVHYSLVTTSGNATLTLAPF